MNSRNESNGPDEQKNDYVEGEFDIEIPDELKCSITLDIMEDPVMASDGHSYERTAITAWLASGRRISPKAGDMLAHTLLTPNHALRQAIQTFLTQRPGLVAINKEIHAKRSLEQQMKDLEIAIQLREEDLAGQFEKNLIVLNQAAEKNPERLKRSSSNFTPNFFDDFNREQASNSSSVSFSIQRQSSALDSKNNSSNSEKGGKGCLIL
jgi:hypothetical protein